MHAISSAMGGAAVASAAACGLVTGAGPAAASPIASPAAASSAPAVTGPPASYVPYSPSTSAASDGLAVAGSADHRRPVPGETQVSRWTVTNTGTRAWSRVRLQVTVPARWRPRRTAGCRATGRRLSCELGGLAARAQRRLVFRLVVPARPRYEAVRIRATTTAWSGRYAFAGPAASLSVTVVRAR